MKLIEAMSVDWDPANYEDEYRKRLQAIVRKKRKGGEIKARAPTAGAPSPCPT